MKALTVHAWHSVFESELSANSRVKLSIPLPLKTGTGFHQIAKHDSGAATYGVWIRLLGVAILAPQRGALVYSGKAGLVAHDVESLTPLIGFRQSDVAAAIDLLTEVGWLKWADVDEAQPTRIPAPPLETFIRDLGGLWSYKGKELGDEWVGAVKGMKPSAVRRLFEETAPAIRFPRDFIKARG